MDEQQLREVYEMVDSIPFSRAKKNMNRDFSDGVMMAELIHHYRPKIVQLHSYPAASSAAKKVNNWNTLNTKILKKLGVGLSKKQIDDIVNCVPMAIQAYLYTVLKKFQTPAQQVNVRQQIKKVQAFQNKTLQKSSPKNMQNHNNNQSPSINDQKQAGQIKLNLMLGNQTDEVLSLVEQIEQTYAQLLKLQQISKLKDQVIKNLEKKVEKMVFS